jgi:hypothetical protein
MNERELAGCAAANGLQPLRLIASPLDPSFKTLCCRP